MSPAEYPCLRPVEVIPDPSNRRVILRDPTQLAAGMLVVGQDQLLLFSLMDGSRSWLEIQSDYARGSGNLLLSSELRQVLGQLADAGFLDGPAFEQYYGRLAEEFRTSPCRRLRDPDGFGAPAAELPAYLERALNAHDERRERPPRGTRLAGLVAPHLDFPRGLPCYGRSFAALRRESAPRRVVILGTNHFGRSRSVVGTTRDFETPWGVVETDRDFYCRLEAETGGDLAPYEMDHLREHSIELQVIWLRHVLGREFRIVSFLCPDPSGPRGTAPGDPEGVDLREFARALGDLIRRDPEPTLVVASADLSHAGGYFGDAGRLSKQSLGVVAATDEAALRLVDANDPEEFREHMGGTGNPTRVCSVGCLYALMVSLGGEAEPRRLHYHQAVTEEIDNAVTCASYVFYGW